MTKTYWFLGIILVVLFGALVVDVPPLARFLGLQKQFKVRQGLDLQGGIQLTYKTDLSKVPKGGEGDAASGVVAVIRRRIDALGVAEPVIQKTADNSRVIVELPGITDVQKAIDLIGETAMLEFREGVPGKSLEEKKKTIKSDKYEDWGDIGLTGAFLKKADVQLDQSGGKLTPEPTVAIEFNSEGAKIFSEATKRNLHKPLAIFLDKQLISAPTVRDQIKDGSGIISGGFNLEEARKLAIQLKAGALPIPVKLISQNDIGATLGKESVVSSVVAGILGLLLVMLFMIIYYRMLGVVAAVALAIYAAVTLAIFIAIPVTLTLAGVAGFLLSIGMAVDANILIFERTREEIRAGRSLLAAIDAGFYRAWSSIRDSNISSLITALVLYYFGSGLIRGFAVTLAIGIIVSMFTAITVTHTFLRLIGNSEWLTKKYALWGIKESK